MHGPKLVQLDKAVSEIRSYCWNVNGYVTQGTSKIDLLSYNTKQIERDVYELGRAFRIAGGKIEKIEANRKHPSRSALIWQNGFFGRRIRKTVSMQLNWEAINSPLTLYPEMLDEVCKYVYVPKDMQKAYHEEIERRQGLPNL